MRTIKVSETKAKATISDLLQCMQKSALANGSIYKLHIDFDEIKRGKDVPSNYVIILSRNTRCDECYILGYFAVCYFLCQLFKERKLSSKICLSGGNKICMTIVEREIGTIVKYLNGN